jgi:hypothetical protein
MPVLIECLICSVICSLTLEVLALLFSLKCSTCTTHWIALILALSLLFLQSVVIYWLPKMFMINRFKDQCCRVLLVYNTKLPTSVAGACDFFTKNLGTSYNTWLQAYSQERARRIALGKVLNRNDFVK